MKTRAGRRRPYSAIGVRRLRCVGCGQPAVASWSCCADGNLQRPVCLECDVLLNGLGLVLTRDPQAMGKLAVYMARRRREEGLD